MACFHPLKGFVIGKTKDGKNVLKVVPGRVDHLEMRNGNWLLVSNGFRSPYSERYISDSVLLPCGRCIGCRLEYSRRWADRLMLERGYHNRACFITLTYDPKEEARLQKLGVDPDTGELINSLSLCKRDFQLFMKRLRKHFDHVQIRFFACGEYGPKTLRPHYHAILFGVDFAEDVYSLKQKGPCGDQYFSSPTLEKLWPYGFVSIGECSYESCAYVARYVTKKYKGEAAEFYSARNIEEPFCLMSRKPGIASQYYEDHAEELLDKNQISIATDRGAKNIQVPKFYDSRFELDFPEQYVIMKERRKEAAINAMDRKLSLTDLDMFEYLENEERKTTARIKSLVRSV